MSNLRIINVNSMINIVFCGCIGVKTPDSIGLANDS